MRSHRPERTAERLQAVLARLVREEIRDPRLGFTTVTGVRVSADLEHAVVYVSRLGSERDRRDALSALRHARGYLRRAVAREAGFRHTPDLRFEWDEAIERGARIEEILVELRSEDSEADPESGGSGE
jgi:ribosome-binding factor A